MGFSFIYQSSSANVTPSSSPNAAAYSSPDAAVDRVDFLLLNFPAPYDAGKLCAPAGGTWMGRL
ncbi:MAG TPA: hypothetical protein VES01_09060, partial [Dermatophilaceae bacterium]|nr:hypothetical protein [Dermatophilaceae bacterium]